jgi:hypothetical protein
MSLSVRPSSLQAAVLLPLALALNVAWAQTAPPAQRPPAKPAAAPAAKPAPAAAKPAPAAAAAKPAAKAEDKTLALGGGTGTAAPGPRKPILTRDELRACLNQEVDIRTRIEKHEAARAPLSAEKDEVLKAQEALKPELEAVQARQKAAVADLNAKFVAHGQRVEKFSADVKAFNEANRSGAQAEQRRRQLNDEQAAIGTAAKALEAERAALTEKLQGEAKAFNDKKAAVDARIAEWNARNGAWVDANVKLDEERRGWIDNCADRRYREEDEIAIKAGR